MNEAEGRYGALRQSPLAKQCDTGENQLDIHCQMTRHDFGRRVPSTFSE